MDGPALAFRGTEIADAALAPAGTAKAAWARRSMPVVEGLRQRYAAEQIFKGVRILSGIPVTPESAVLLIALRDCGAEVLVVGSGISSTQDDTAASLAVDYGLPVYAVKGESLAQYNRHLDMGIEWRPDIFLDDGGIFLDRYTAKYHGTDVFGGCVGALEQTTSGLTAATDVQKALGLPYPIINVNDTRAKSLIDNRWGTGQSVVAGLIASTHMLMQGARVCIVGYGRVGGNIALQLKSRGAVVTIVETDPFKALEAFLDGYRVRDMAQAMARADVVISATGVHNTIGREEALLMQDGCIIANAGHDRQDIDMDFFERDCPVRDVDTYARQYRLPNGRSVCLLCGGGVVNLGADQGNPAAVMDLSFGCSFLAAQYLLSQGTLEKRLHPLPEALDRELVAMKLRCLMEAQG